MIREIIKERILVLDGALGTMIQSYNLTEEQFQGERYSGWGIELKGCNDILVFTAPHIIKEIHTQYLEAGADIITTNSFNSNSISMEEYGVAENVYELNFTAASLARQAIKEGGYSNRFVAGSVGPTGRTASMSPSVEDPAFRNITFDQLRLAYITQIEGLVDGGADVILLETIFDTLNAKAAIAAHNYVCRCREKSVPLMISATIDNSGRTLSGQTIEALYHSLSYSEHLLSVGLNCSFGAELLYPFLKRLASCSTHYISVHPNAGLPDIFGNYTHTPEIMCSHIESYLEDNLVNIVGGCCGSTPQHIAKIKQSIEQRKPHTPKSKSHTLTLTGLEPLTFNSSLGFINIGERANVAGSAKFAKLIAAGEYESGVEIVKSQIESGAAVIDICMDDAMLDSQKEICHFLNLLASEPDAAAVPLMVDSSKWSTLLSAMKCIQGKCIVNSISLKEGEEQFLNKAYQIYELGCAVVVMLFDERGQADSYERKCEVAARSYSLLVGCGFAPEDIIFDPNVLTVATGIEEHNNYAIDFIKAVKYIKENLPYAKVSGGVSNLSFALRGNNPVREAMHSAFLYHAIAVGMDMAIVNGGALPIYENIDKTLLKCVEDVIFNSDSHATERLIDYATEAKAKQIAIKEGKVAVDNTISWREESLNSRIEYGLVRGVTDYIDSDILEAYNLTKDAVAVIEGVLMNGMSRVGELFNSGKMFLPQVVKSARVMKRAVENLLPYLEASSGSTAGKVVIATVKGDVHDIGKNIVSIVLQCNGFEVIDLGVMTPEEKILEAINNHNPKLLVLSGLITPSLDEMSSVLDMLTKEGKDIDVLVGGATTSQMHTAVKLAPRYQHLVAQTSDASSCGKLAVELTGSNRAEVVKMVKESQKAAREQYLKELSSKELLSVEKARENRAKLDFSLIKKPNFIGEKQLLNINISEVAELINWTQFFAAWGIKGQFPTLLSHPEKGEEATKLYNDAKAMLLAIENKIEINGKIAILDSHSTTDDKIIVTKQSGERLELAMERNLSQVANDKNNLSLADFIAAESDYLGFLNVSVFGTDQLCKEYKESGDNYNSLLVSLLSDRLVEAASELLHFKMRTQYWGYSQEEFTPKELLKGNFKGIRPAFGYPSLPNHAQKESVFNFLDITKSIGTTLTENWAMLPQSSICAVVFGHPDSKYFVINS